MPEEFKTLLTIDGDATGGKRAAEEIQRSLGQVTARAQQAAAATREAASAASQYVNSGGLFGSNAPSNRDPYGSPGGGAPIVQTGGTPSGPDVFRNSGGLFGAPEAAGNVKKAAEGMGDLRRNAAAFGEVMSRVDPMLGALITSATKLKEIFAFMFSPIGLAVAGAIAAFVAVKKVIDEATASAKAFAEAQERARVASRDRQSTVNDLAAQAGLSVDAADQARGRAETLRNLGFDDDTAALIGVAVTGADGEQTVSDQERLLLAGAAQAGQVTIDPSKRGRSRGLQVQRALRQIQRSEDGFNATSLVLTEQERELELALGGQEEEIRKQLAELGLSGEALEKRFALVSRQLKEGPRRTKDEIAPTGVGGVGKTIERVEDLDPLIPTLRVRQEQLGRLRDQARENIGDVRDALSLLGNGRSSVSNLTVNVVNNHGTLVQPGTTGFEKAPRGGGQ